MKLGNSCVYIRINLNETIIMKTQKFKLSITQLGITALSITLLLLVIYSCNKDVECVECKKNKNIQTRNIVLGETMYTASAYYEANEDNDFAVTIFNSEDIPDMNGTIDSILNLYELTLPESQSGEKVLFGLTLFYGASLEESLGTIPNGILLYHTNTSTQRSYATFWKKNADNSFDLKPDLSGITTYVSRTNFYQLNQALNMNTQEALLFLDRPNMPSNHYRTVFQIKLETATSNPSATEAPNGSGGGSCSACGAVFNGCCKEDLFGESCDIVPVCTGGGCDMVLNTGGYYFTQEDYDYLYWIRDSVLMGTEKGQEIIDDYYYSGEIMRGNITFSLAWKLYRLFGIDLFSRFPQFFTSTAYDGDILVSDEVQEIVSEMADEASNISNDPRFQSIIANIQNQVNDYHNQPFSYIRSSLQ